MEQIIKCLYIKAEKSDERRATKVANNSNVDNTATDGGGGGGGSGGGGGGGGGGCPTNGSGRYRFYNDKTVIQSTLDDLDDDPADGHTVVDVVGGGGGGGSCSGGETAGTATVDGGAGVTRDSYISYSSVGGGDRGSGGGGGGAGGGGVVGFSSSPDEHDSDSVVSDTLMKEEHDAFMDPALHHHHDLDLPLPYPFPFHHAHSHTHDPDYELEHVPVTLRCSHAPRSESHSQPELAVTKVVKQLSQADLTRRAHFRSIIYIMALSLHGIFEGLALGLQSRESSVWSLCFALCLHRCVLAFQLGMDLCGARESQGTAFLCIGTFTLISALGIVFGILFSSGALLYTDVTVPEAILQSLATGTILYIVFFDILFKDLQGVGDLKRVSSCFVGFSLMAIILAITTR